MSQEPSDYGSWSRRLPIRLHQQYQHPYQTVRIGERINRRGFTNNPSGLLLLTGKHIHPEIIIAFPTSQRKPHLSTIIRRLNNATLVPSGPNFNITPDIPSEGIDRLQSHDTLVRHLFTFSVPKLVDLGEK